MKVRGQLASTNEFEMHGKTVSFPLPSLEKMEKQAPGLPVYKDYDESKLIGRVLSSEINNENLFIVIDLDLKNIELGKINFTLPKLDVDGCSYNFIPEKIGLISIGFTADPPLDKSLQSISPDLKPIEDFSF